MHHLVVGVLYNYFAAPSDGQAAAAIDLAGGPAGAEPLSAELAAAIQAGDREAIRRLNRPMVRLSEHGLHAFSVKGIDPELHMDTVEELLTGVGAGRIRRRERFCKDVATSDDGGMVVLTLTDELQTALAEASDHHLADAAVAWSQHEDFGGRAEHDALVNFLRALASLARTASTTDQHLYCWICL